MFSSNMPKRSAEDILIQITIANRGPELATPCIFFHTMVSQYMGSEETKRKAITLSWKRSKSDYNATHLDTRRLLALLRTARLQFYSQKMRQITKSFFKLLITSPYVKDGFNEYFIHEHREAVNPESRNKSRAYYTA